jgi:hypothetical protein
VNLTSEIGHILLNLTTFKPADAPQIAQLPSVELQSKTAGSRSSRIRTSLPLCHWKSDKKSAAARQARTAGNIRDRRAPGLPKGRDDAPRIQDGRQSSSRRPDPRQTNKTIENRVEFSMHSLMILKIDLVFNISWTVVSSHQRLT